MVWAAGLGLTAPLAAYPGVHYLLSAVGAAWLGWLAWRLFRSAGDPVSTAHANYPATGALTGAGLQVVNPKVWMMALAVVGVFAPSHADASGATLRALIFLIVAFAGLLSWGVLGRYGVAWLGSGRQRRLCNRSMALLLVIAACLSILF